MNLIDLPAPSGDNPGGTLQKVSVAPLRGFRRLAVPKGSGTPKNLVLIDETHYLREGFAWKHFSLTINKNQLNGEAQAGVGGSHKFNLPAFMSNLSALQQGTLRTLLAEPFVALVYLANGQVLQLGEKDNGASCDFGVQTGTQEGGETGSPINLFAYHSPRFYAGGIRDQVLPLFPSGLNGQSAGTYYGRWYREPAPTPAGFRTLARWSDGSTDQQIWLRVDETNALTLLITKNGVDQLLWEGPTKSKDVQVAFSFSTDEFRVAVNGVQHELIEGPIDLPTTNTFEDASGLTSVVLMDQGAIAEATDQDYLEGITSY